MRQKYEPQEPHELAEAREARPSGAMRVTSDADAPGEDDQTIRLITRPNSRLPILPSILVDASYLQVVSAVRKQQRRRNLSLALAAVGAFLFGGALPVGVNILRQMASPAAPIRVVTTVGASTRAGASTSTPPGPASAAPTAAAPHRAQMDQRQAARHVHRAEGLREAGRAHDAWSLLTDVLRDRPGYPPALAAVAKLELDSGHAAAAVRWARRAVRSLPSSVENWELLSKACTAAGLDAESTRARLRAAQLARKQQW